MTLRPVSLLNFHALKRELTLQSFKVVVVPNLSPPTVSSTTPPAAACTGSIIQNGNFETGNLSPWVVTDTVGQTTNSIVSPGEPQAGSNNYAFSASLQGTSSLTLQQTMSTCAGTNYSIRADFYSGSTALGDCSLEIEYPYKTTTGGVIWPSNIGPVKTWQTTVATFQAVSDADVFKIVMKCTNGQSNVYEVDNVNIAYYPYNAF